jgi:hypothetical protein
MKTFAFAVSLMMIGCGQPDDPSAEGTAELAAASCKAASDCHGALPKLCKLCPVGETGGCAHYDCVANKCEIAYCEAAPTPPPPPSCKVASDCKGPLPSLCKTCSDGETGGCAHYDCVANQCEIAYCEPAPAPPSCTKASDCHGILPQICEVCGNGKEECEHFVCVEGQCQEQLCPQCTRASDCTGPLPQLCEICSNGKQECAHHACESGVCTTQICQ